MLASGAKPVREWRISIREITYLPRGRSVGRQGGPVPRAFTDTEHEYCLLLADSMRSTGALSTTALERKAVLREATVDLRVLTDS